MYKNPRVNKNFDEEKTTKTTKNQTYDISELEKSISTVSSPQPNPNPNPNPKNTIIQPPKLLQKYYHNFNFPFDPQITILMKKVVIIDLNSIEIIILKKNPRSDFE